MTPEARVKAAIDKLLDKYDAYYHKPVQNGMGAPGLDYWVCHKGFFCAIEAKKPGGHMTDRQVRTAIEVEKAQGSVFCINSAVGTEVNELMSWLEFPRVGFLGRNWQSEFDLYEQRSGRK